MVTIRTSLNRSGTSTVNSFNPDPLGITPFGNNSVTDPSRLFNDLSALSPSELNKFQIEQQAFLNTSTLLAQYEEQQRQAREAREAYDKVLRDRKISAERARSLTQEQNEVQLRLANYRKEIAGINASQVINNAFAIARSGMADLQLGIRQTTSNRSSATALFAKGGVEVGKGSAALVVDNITKEGFRQVNNNFADSLNKVNAQLAQAFTLNFNAEMDLLATEEQNRLNLKITELNLD